MTNNANSRKYRTAGGNVVNWRRGADGYGRWTCEGCGERDWGEGWAANDHAASCRAI